MTKFTNDIDTMFYGMDAKVSWTEKSAGTIVNKELKDGMVNVCEAALNFEGRELEKEVTSVISCHLVTQNVKHFVKTQTLSS